MNPDQPSRGAGPLRPKHTSFQPVLRSRLLPKISFRSAFVIMTLGAIVFAIARSAGGGAAFAAAVIAVLVFFAALIALCSVFFLAAWLFARAFGPREQGESQGNPFADGQLPPQQLPPRDPLS